MSGFPFMRGGDFSKGRPVIESFDLSEEQFELEVRTVGIQEFVPFGSCNRLSRFNFTRRQRCRPQIKSAIFLGELL